MGIRKITVLLKGVERDCALLDSAFAVSRRTIAHLDAVYLTLGPAEIETFRDHFFPEFPHDMEVKYLAECRSLAEQSRRQFDAWRQGQGLADWDGAAFPLRTTAAWREDARSADEAVRRLGRFCDLVVMHRPSGRLSALGRFILEALLFGSGHPTLLIPPSSAGLVLKSAVIAWNGSAEATHAVTAALPLLRGMERVSILVAADPLDPNPEAEQLADYLRWHQIEAGIVLASPAQPIGALLLAEATRLGADLLVLGAYTHHPTREQILGGATLHILKHAEIPVLMAH